MLMLIFFRKTRINLLSEQKMKKYWLYAIGEVLLVMIGILLALQVNNWNENRKNRITENHLKSALYLDFSESKKDWPILEFI